MFFSAFGGVCRKIRISKFKYGLYVLIWKYQKAIEKWKFEITNNSSTNSPPPNTQPKKKKKKKKKFKKKN